MTSDPSGTRVEATVLRTVGPPGSLFELLLPPGMRVLSGELAEVDRLLDDKRFFGPFRPFFDPTEGRPSIPIETYLRLMFLKYRYGLGYWGGTHRSAGNGCHATLRRASSSRMRGSWWSRLRRRM